LIVCETHRGFHASLCRGNPCTLVRKKKDAGFALLEQVKGRQVAAFLCHSRAKRRIPVPSSPCQGEDEGEGLITARDSFRARFKILLLLRRTSAKRDLRARVNRRFCRRFGASTSSVQSGHMWLFRRDDRHAPARATSELLERIRRLERR
jgi:hypothetical protein